MFKAVPPKRKIFDFLSHFCGISSDFIIIDLKIQYLNCLDCIVQTCSVYEIGIIIFGIIHRM